MMLGDDRRVKEGKIRRILSGVLLQLMEREGNERVAFILHVRVPRDFLDVSGHQSLYSGESFIRLILMLKRLGLEVGSGVFLPRGEGTDHIALVVEGDHAPEFSDKIAEEVRKELGGFVHVEMEPLCGLTSPLLRCSVFDRVSSTQDVMLRSLFHIFKRTWGVLSNTILYHTGAKAGAMLAHELSKLFKHRALESCLKELLEFWRNDGFVENYELNVEAGHIDVMLKGLVEYDSKRSDSPAYFVKGFLSGFVSTLLREDCEVQMHEGGTEVRYFIRPQKIHPPYHYFDR